MAILLPIAVVIPFLPFLYTSILLIIRQCRSPLRHLPGPPSPSFFMGNLREMHDQENTNLITQWVAQYGPTFVYRGFLGGRRLITTDPLAIAHILGNSYQYQKPDFIREVLASMAMGYDGLLTVEGDHHQRQVLATFPFLYRFFPITIAIFSASNIGKRYWRLQPIATYRSSHLLSRFLISNLLPPYFGKKQHRSDPLLFEFRHSC